jgi:hypothetical protein
VALRGRRRAALALAAPSLGVLVDGCGERNAAVVVRHPKLFGDPQPLDALIAGFECATGLHARRSTAGCATWSHLLDANESADFFLGPLASVTWRDRVYALPWFADTGLLYYSSRSPQPRPPLRGLSSRTAYASGSLSVSPRIDGSHSSFVASGTRRSWSDQRARTETVLIPLRRH